ncbi:MAG: hypothetical protein GF329_14515 [Candidatus Lokiarchaeota archaeon]|nr:hypothetical protein [Candidatus Lokiarchaeota archaeon]
MTIGKNMLLWKKLFLSIGIPLLAFYIFMTVIYFGFLSTVWFIALIVGLCCLRKNRIWRRATKMSVALFIFMFLLIWNPLYWPAQISRHLDTSQIITPNATAVQNLNSTTPGNFWDYLNGTYGVNASQFYTNSTEVQQFHYIEEFVLDKIEFKYLLETYGVIDYVATPTEAIVRGKGDCQSRTVVMTSFLIYMGYDAWAVETPFHWYTRAYLSNGSYIYLYRNNRTEPIVRMNHEQVVFEMNLFESSLLVLTHHRITDPLNSLFSQPTFWMVILPISFGISFLLVLLIKTSGVTTKKKKISNTLFGGTFLNLSFLLLLALSTIVPSLSLIILIISIILTVQLISHNFFMAPEVVDLERREEKNTDLK